MENLKSNSEVNKIVEEIYFFIVTRQQNNFNGNFYIHFSCDVRTEILNYLYKKNPDESGLHYSILADYYLNYMIEHTEYINLIEQQQNKYYNLANSINKLAESYFNEYNKSNDQIIMMIFNRLELNITNLTK